MREILILFILVFWGYSASGQSSTSYDVEFSRICLIDSIAPDTLTQFWRFTQANNPGGIVRDYTYDLSATYTVAGTVRPCCSCLTSASDTAALEIPGGPGTNWGAIGFLAFLGLIVFAFIFLLYLAETKAARFACTFFFLTLIPVSQGFAQSETSYDVEFTCICLVDSIAADNIVQFWRFTQANNPGGITRDYTYDLSATYTVAGTVIGCKDYYLGDNPGGSGTAGTLAIWTGTETLGNSSLTESAEEAVWDLTGSITVPSGTDAQVPVWGPGKLRYNTTGGGFQGGPNGHYLAFYSGLTSNYYPRWDGSKLVNSGTFRPGSSYSIILDGQLNSISDVHAIIGTGYQNSIQDRYSFIGSGNNNTIGSAAERSFIGAGNGNQTLSPYSAIPGGNENSISLNAQNSFVGAGQGNSASKPNSYVVGGAFGQAAHLGGMAHAAGRFSATGDAQYVRIIGTANITGADTVRLLLGSPMGTGDILNLQNFAVWNCLVQITASVDNAGSSGTLVDGDSGVYIRQVAIKRGATAGSTVIIGSPVIIGSDLEDTNFSSADIAIIANTTNGSLDIEFQTPSTVAGDTVIRVVGTIHITELNY